MPRPPSVLFLCVHNAGKSQIAAAVMRQVAGDAVEVHSAGTHPDPQVHEESAQAVLEVGADMSAQVPAPIDPALLHRADRVVILGDEAQVDPVDGMRATLERWVVVEPADRGITGLERTRLIRDDIAAQVRALALELVPGADAR